MVTTTGAKTGQPRMMPVVAVPDGDHLMALGSNWGQRQHPAWYYNLRAHPTATVTVGGVPRRVQAMRPSGGSRSPDSPGCALRCAVVVSYGRSGL